MRFRSIDRSHDPVWSLTATSMAREEITLQVYVFTHVQVLVHTSYSPPCKSPAHLLQRGYNCLAVGADKLALVASDVVDMYLVEAEIEEALDMLAVSIEAGR